MSDLQHYTFDIAKKMLSGENYQVFAETMKTISTTNIPSHVLNTDILSPETNLAKLLQKKHIHTVAALNYFEDVLNLSNQTFELRQETVIAILLFELTQVDYADSLGEIEELRNFSGQLKLFEGLKNNALYGKDLPLFDLARLPSEKSFILKQWQSYLNQLCIQFFNILSEKVSWSKLAKIIDRRLTEYYHMILFDHVRTKQEKQKAEEWFIHNTFSLKGSEWKTPPDWIESLTLWINFLGDSISFLVPVFLILEFNRSVSPEYILSQIKAFRGVGALNVLLDDIIDMKEDKERNDTNLIIELSSGLYEKEVFLAKKTYQIEGDDPITSFSKGLIALIRQDFVESSKEVANPKLFINLSLITSKMLKWYLLMAVEQSVPKRYIALIQELISFDKRLWV